MPDRPAPCRGGHDLLHPPHAFADRALCADLHQSGVSVFHELGVVPAGGGGGADREIERSQHGEHGVGQIGGPHAAFQVVQHLSMVGHDRR